MSTRNAALLRHTYNLRSDSLMDNGRPRRPLPPRMVRNIISRSNEPRTRSHSTSTQRLARLHQGRTRAALSDYSNRRRTAQNQSSPRGKSFRTQRGTKFQGLGTTRAALSSHSNTSRTAQNQHAPRRGAHPTLRARGYQAPGRYQTRSQTALHTPIALSGLRPRKVPSANLQWRRANSPPLRSHTSAFDSPNTYDFEVGALRTDVRDFHLGSPDRRRHDETHAHGARQKRQRTLARIKDLPARGSGAQRRTQARSPIFSKDTARFQEQRHGGAGIDLSPPRFFERDAPLFQEKRHGGAGIYDLGPTSLFERDAPLFQEQRHGETGRYNLHSTSRFTEEEIPHFEHHRKPLITQRESRYLKKHVEHWHSNLTPQLVADNPGYLFIFSDNDSRRGEGGQACIRYAGQNVAGIATCENSNREYYWYERDQEEYQAHCDRIDEDIKGIVARAMNEKLEIVIPISGFGNGLAQLAKRAPKVYAHLCARLQEVFQFTNPGSKHVVEQRRSAPDTWTHQEQPQQQSAAYDFIHEERPLRRSQRLNQVYNQPNWFSSNLDNWCQQIDSKLQSANAVPATENYSAMLEFFSDPRSRYKVGGMTYNQFVESRHSQGLMEKFHNFVQTTAPTRSRSYYVRSLNYTFDSAATIQQVRRDPFLRESILREAVELMQHWGLTLNIDYNNLPQRQSDGSYGIRYTGSEKVASVKSMWSSKNHNQERVSRLLSCFVLLGEYQLAKELSECAVGVGSRGGVPASNLTFWKYQWQHEAKLLADELTIRNPTDKLPTTHAQSTAIGL